MVTHGLYQHQRTAYVVLIILNGLAYRFSYSLEPCKMYAGVKPVLLQDLVQPLAVAYIDLVERYLRTAQYPGYTFQTLRAGVAQIVHNHCGMTRLVKLYYGVRSYESRSTGYQNIHQSIFFFSTVQSGRCSRPQGFPLSIAAASLSPLSCHSSQASAAIENSPP